MNNSAIKLVHIEGQYINPAHVIRVYSPKVDTSYSPPRTRIQLVDENTIAVELPIEAVVEALQA